MQEIVSFSFYRDNLVLKRLSSLYFYYIKKGVITSTLLMAGAFNLNKILKQNIFKL